MLGAFLISILVGAIVYFLLISPELDKTSTARDELERAREFNDLLDTQILAAQAAEKNVDDWYAEIAAIRLDLPPTPEQAAFERIVINALQAQGLPTVGITFAAPADVVPPTSVVEAGSADPATEPTPADAGEAAEATPEPTPAPSAEPAAPGDETPAAPESPQAAGLVQSTVTITTEGMPAPILRFLLDLQTQNDRFFTVTSFDIVRSAGADAQAGRPAIVEGDWVINVTGLIFNLFDPELSLPVTEPAETPPYTGGEVPNAFVPIPGTGNEATA